MSAESQRGLTVPSPDMELAQKLSAELAQQGWGTLARAAGFLAGRGLHPQHSEDPNADPLAMTLVVIAGDNGLPTSISRHPQADYTATAFSQLTSGATLLSDALRDTRSGLRAVDVAIDHDVWGDERVSRAAGRIDIEDALSEDDFKRALGIGRRIADQLIDSGTRIFAATSLGRGDSTIAATLMGVFTRTEPVAVAGTPYLIGDEPWCEKVSIIRNAMFRVRQDLTRPHEVLRRVGSPSAAVLTGFIAQAASRRTPILIDAPLGAVAAYCADRLAPGAAAWVLPTQAPSDPAEELALRIMSAQPLVDMGISYGMGAGALATVPVLRQAARLL